ncbi:MAG: hypothetical protein QXZ48_05610 [Zestosphaera sp.]
MYKQVSRVGGRQRTTLFMISESKESRKAKSTETQEKTKSKK